MKNDILKTVHGNTLAGQDSILAYLSGELKLPRNTVAKELNQLCQEGKVICIQTQPKRYLSYQGVQEIYHINLETFSFESEEAFKAALRREDKKDFENLIGHNGSLIEVIEMCKAAIAYPHFSLPLLLHGPTGTGKSYIAHLIHEYAINQSIIEPHAPIVSVNCSEYANNPELLSANLFGHKKGAYTGADEDNDGLLAVANGGILFLDEVHCLQPESQEKLFLFMDKGEYQRVGENDVWHTSHVRFVFATTENPEEALLKTLLRRIPIVVSIPSLQERGSGEKANLIHHIFAHEQTSLQQPIELSTNVYNLLLNHHFIGNVGGLKNTIKVCIARALSQTNGGPLTIKLIHLPSSIFSDDDAFEQQRFDDRSLISIDDIKTTENPSNTVLNLYSKILAIDSLNASAVDQFLTHFSNVILKENFNSNNKKIQYVSRTIEDIVQDISSRYRMKVANNTVRTISRYVELLIRYSIPIGSWNQTHKDEISNFASLQARTYPFELKVASVVASKITHSLDLQMDTMFIQVLTLLFAGTQLQDSSHRIGIIIAHGFSTASSISQATNQLLEANIFEPFDMPLDVTTDQIIDQLNRFLEDMPKYDEIILLVDMGSLEKIDSGISGKVNARVGIINNITTKLALEIGYGILQDVPLEALLEKVSANNRFTYRIAERKQKDNVILCSCASGVGTAERIQKLLDDSFPLTSNIKTLTYDFNTLSTQKEQNEIFQSYNVLCIVGTLDPLIPNIPFFAIENFIIDNEVDEISNVLGASMESSEIESFKTKLLLNFSLTNMMEYLTILNPNKLLEHVASALENFQEHYDVQLTNSVSVGLYVHICCMVERMIVKAEIESHPNIDDIQKHYPEFIFWMQESLKPVESFYRINIPIDEIGYIYEYIEAFVTK